MKKIRIQHSTIYTYESPVTLLPHKLMIRPRSGYDIQVEHSSLTISPANTIKWQRDINGNSVAIVTFTEPTTELAIISDLTISHYESEPLDFVVDEKAAMFPFYFDPSERVDLIPFQTLSFPGDSAVVRDWLQQFWQPGQTIETYVLLDRINQEIVKNFTYRMREEPGVQRPAKTLKLRAGSCQDFATLFIEACRYFGLPARFVSGYLHCPETVHGHGSTHAWSEVYLPGAGWKGFDNTSGIVVGEDHIAVAVTRHPEDAPPVSGSYAGTVSVPSTLQLSVVVETA
jgi:transglutaminase-like putative cysteine protease